MEEGMAHLRNDEETFRHNSMENSTQDAGIIERMRKCSNEKRIPHMGNETTSCGVMMILGRIHTIYGGILRKKLICNKLMHKRGNPVLEYHN
jgi:hypothetical protein